MWKNYSFDIVSKAPMNLVAEISIEVSQLNLGRPVLQYYCVPQEAIVSHRVPTFRGCSPAQSGLLPAENLFLPALPSVLRLLSLGRDK